MARKQLARPWTRPEGTRGHQAHPQRIFQLGGDPRPWAGGGSRIPGFPSTFCWLADWLFIDKLAAQVGGRGGDRGGEQTQFPRGGQRPRALMPPLSPRPGHQASPGRRPVLRDEVHQRRAHQRPGAGGQRLPCRDPGQAGTGPLPICTAGAAPEVSMRPAPVSLCPRVPSVLASPWSCAAQQLLAAMP